MICREVFCTFCNRHCSEVERVVSGPKGVYLCSDCIRLAWAIVMPPRDEDGES